MRGHRPSAASPRLALLLTLSTMTLFVPGCASERPPPPAQAIPCSVGDPPLTARDADAVSTPLARWLHGFIARREAACGRRQ